MIDDKSLHDTIIDDLGLNFDLKLPDSIPTALITQEFIEEMKHVIINGGGYMNKTIFKATNLLFCKYLHHDSILEVNVSSKNRRIMVNVFNNEESIKTVETLLPPLERAAKEISALIHDSQN